MHKYVIFREKLDLEIKENSQIENQYIMFTAIRYWFQREFRAIIAWLGRPRNVEVATQDVVRAMEHLGITVVDASIYPKSRNDRVVGVVVIVAGYIPEKALIFKVNFNYKDFDVYKFTVEGQLKEGELGKMFDSGVFFSRLKRSAVGSESYDPNGMFQVNTYTSYNQMRNKTSRSKVIYGMDFFRKFIDEYGVLVKPRFDSTTHLWFVPEYSDEFNALESKNGQYSGLNYVGFNSRVMEKFPHGFFCKTQKA